MRTTAIGALTLVGALTFASIRQGAYHESQHQLFAIVMGAAGVVLLVVDRKWRPLRFAAIVMTPLLASTILSTLLATTETIQRARSLPLRSSVSHSQSAPPSTMRDGNSRSLACSA